MSRTGSVTIESRDGQTWVTMSGDVDLHVVDTVELADVPWLMGDDTAILVDMGGLTFLDSLGIGLLSRLREYGEVTLVHVPPVVHRLLEITGLVDLFTIQK